MHRRHLLAALGGGLTTGASGCLGSLLGPESSSPPTRDVTYDEDQLTQAVDYPLPRAVALARVGTDGNWWVLEHSMDAEGHGAAFEYTSDWRPTGTARAIELRRDDYGIPPMDVANRPGGGWYVLGQRGRVYGFDADWTATGEQFELPRRSAWVRGRGSYGLERTSAGWWASAHGRLTLYDHALEEVRASYDGYDDLDLGTEYYNEHYGRMTVGRIRTVHVTPAGDLLLRANLGNKIYVFDDPGPSGLSSTTPAETLTPATNPPSGYGLASTPDGTRYILRGKGLLYEYTSDWEYTGSTIHVGSGNALDRYPPDDLG